MHQLTDATRCHCCNETVKEVFVEGLDDEWCRTACPGCDRPQWFCPDCVENAFSIYVPAAPVGGGPVLVPGCSGCLGCWFAQIVRTAGPLRADTWWVGGQLVEDECGRWRLGRQVVNMYSGGLAELHVPHAWGPHGR